MALQSIVGGLWVPRPWPVTANAMALLAGGFATLDAGDEACGMVFRASKAGTINTIVYGTRAVTTGATLDVRLETVDATTGGPTGTLFGANTNGASVVASSDDNVLKTVTLTTGASVSKGDLIAVRIVNPSASPGTLVIAGEARTVYSFPYGFTLLPALAKTTALPTLGIGYDDGTFGQVHGTAPWSAITGTTFNSGSTPDERGLYFQVPFSCRVAGTWGLLSGTGDCDLILYDSDGTTVIATASLDKDVVAGTAGNPLSLVTFAASPTLSASTNYRLVVKPTSVTNTTLYDADVGSAAQMDAFDGGQNFHYTQRTDAGAWTQTTTKRPFLGLMIDAIDTGSGGGLMMPTSGRIVSP